MQTKTILLLGGFGFIGTNIIKFVDEHQDNDTISHYRFVVFDKFSSHLRGIQFNCISKVYAGDFSDQYIAEGRWENGWDDKFIDGLQKVTSRVHEYGAKIVPQLYHAGRQTRPDCIGGDLPGAPTAIPCSMKRSQPRELTAEEIYAIIERFGDAAVRAKKAGFDGVEIHGGHGYLVSEFISSYYNKRYDEFGGSFEARMNFPVKIIQNIKEKCGKDFPVIFRLSAEELCPGGRTIEETKMVCKELDAQ